MIGAECLAIAQLHANPLGPCWISDKPNQDYQVNGLKMLVIECYNWSDFGTYHLVGNCWYITLCYVLNVCEIKLISIIDGSCFCKFVHSLDQCLWLFYYAMYIYTYILIIHKCEKSVDQTCTMLQVRSLKHPGVPNDKHSKSEISIIVYLWIFPYLIQYYLPGIYNYTLVL